MIALLTGLLSTAVLAGGVLSLAAIGEVLAERVGVTDLGVEGLMSLGAATAIVTVMAVPDPWAGLLAALAVGALGGAVFAFAAVVMRANQVLCGLAITFLGLGLSATIGHSVAGMPAPVTFAPVRIPVLGSLPVIGPAFFAQNLLVVPVYLLLPAFFHWLLFHTRHGLNMRAVGENPAAADAAGIPVVAMRFCYVVVGAALAGAAGAYLSLAVIPSWSEGMVSGRGWIAVALVIFAGYRPFNAAAAGLLFGLITAIGFLGQARGWPIAAPVLNMLPYLGTLAFIILPVVLWKRMRRVMAAPAALGVPYYRSVR
ncbi:ABC transporter permease [Acetobacter oeni]|uniref:ABC transporter permease n=1 Tax=Acetobacter oeni TaxID=304077 RepID=A0A511XQ06_9PROT|nr:ABC transporter permease [Acetobacter oeni]MBB3884715.1 simple sugar transport system permease protein [Acetobacter oeni]NHO20653.1 ABC transporter permease [Acetobacter oeni]GBR04772.1 inner-membrane translocator [Acetobacter oeni LMG 21952]GEN65043.1 ABC transporter permease [Acetobacter oeni]